LKFGAEAAEAAVVAAVRRESPDTLVSTTNLLYVLQLKVLMLLINVAILCVLLLAPVGTLVGEVLMVVKLSLLDQD
jgi:hypothetical protein